jgi:hypothetical protein
LLQARGLTALRRCPPYLVLPVDTSGETGANPPRADGYVSIPQTLPNFARYPPQ